MCLNLLQHFVALLQTFDKKSRSLVAGITIVGLLLSAVYCSVPIPFSETVQVQNEHGEIIDAKIRFEIKRSLFQPDKIKGSVEMEGIVYEETIFPEYDGSIKIKLHYKWKRLSWGNFFSHYPNPADRMKRQVIHVSSVDFDDGYKHLAALYISGHRDCNWTLCDG